MSKMGQYVFDLMEQGEYDPEDYGWYIPDEDEDELEGEDDE